MRLVRVGFAFMAMTLSAVAVPVVVTGGVLGAGVAAAADLSVETFCASAGTLVGTTFTLNTDCGPTTVPLFIPDGHTLNGNNHTISADDNGAGVAQFNGAILTNEVPGGTMNIENVTVTGPAGGFRLCTNSDFLLYGILFNDASGTVNNVIVDHIFQIQNGAFGSCQTGRAIRAEGVAAQTVTITDTTVKDYQKSGFEPRGAMTMNLSGSTAGPPHSLEGLISQNGVSYVGAQGTVENNTIFGSGNAQDGVGGNGAGTAVLLSGAHDVTVTNNTLTSPAAPRPGTDVGISVSAGSTTGIVISFNKVNRLGPDVPDTAGIGIDVFTPDGSTATLMCNTFSGWTTNVVGAEQIPCTPLPNGSECQAYSAPAPAVDSGKNYEQTRDVPHHRCHAVHLDG